MGNEPTETQCYEQIREHAIILTFLRSWLRVEELCGVTIDRVTLTERKGYFYVKGKGGKEEK